MADETPVDIGTAQNVLGDASIAPVKTQRELALRVAQYWAIVNAQFGGRQQAPGQQTWAAAPQSRPWKRSTAGDILAVALAAPYGLATMGQEDPSIVNRYGDDPD